MAKVDIGNLVVKISGNAEALDKEIQGAERRLTGFANKISSPLNALRGLGGGITNLVGGPINSLITDVTRFTGLIPGLGAISEVLAHPLEAAKESMERLDKLGEDASRIGLDTQFLRGLQIAAEAEVGSIGSVMPKLLKFQAQLRSGSEDLIQPGGTTAAKKALERGLDISAWKAANPEELFFLFAKGAQKAAQSGTEFAFATEIAGKGAANFMNTLMNPEGVEHYVKNVREASVATKENVMLASMWDDVLKDVAIQREAAQESMLSKTGMIGMGWDKMKARQYGSGSDDIAAGIANAINSLVGMDAAMPKRSIGDLISKTGKEIESAVSKGGDLAGLEGLAGDLQRITDVFTIKGESTMPFRFVTQLAAIAQQAKDLIPKTPGNNLQEATEKAAALKKELEQVGETAKQTGAVFEQQRLSDIAAGHSLRDQAMTPGEKAMKELEKAQQLLGGGQISGDTFERTLQRMKSGLTPKEGPLPDANVALRGSQEWARAFTGGKAETQDAEALKKQQETVDVLKEIERLLRLDKGPQPINAVP